MAMDWLRREQKDPDNNQGEFKPEQLKTEIETSTKAQFDAFKADMDERLKPVSEIATFLAEQRAAAASRAAAAANKKDEPLADDDDLYITNPAEAQRRAMAPIIQQSQATAALLMRKEVLSEKEYYHGDFKAEVDRLLDQQDLGLRSRTDVINNCYKIVLANHMDEIAEGKLKKRTFGATFTSSGTGSASGNSNKEEDEKLSDEEAFFARKFGMDDKQWRESKRELNYV